MIKKSLLIAAMFVVQASACFGAILSEPWTVNIKQHGHYSWTWKQGESVDMQPALLDGFKPLNLTGATVKFYWYTNTTDNTWWEQPVTITADSSGKLSLTWLPSMDVGAKQYAYWFGIWPAGSDTPVWRVTGTINILPSPGFEPNTLTLPVKYLDFGTLHYTNAPWATPAQLITATNVLEQAVASAVHSTSNALAMAIAEPVTKLYSSNSNLWAKLEDNGVTAYNIVTFTNIVPAYVVTYLNFSGYPLAVGDTYIYDSTITNQIATGPYSPYTETTHYYYKDGDQSGQPLIQRATTSVHIPQYWGLTVDPATWYTFSYGGSPTSDKIYLQYADRDKIYMDRTSVTRTVTGTNTTVYASQTYVDDAISNIGPVDLSSRVPYSGAATDVDLGAHSLSALSLTVSGDANGYGEIVFPFDGAFGYTPEQGVFYMTSDLWLGHTIMDAPIAPDHGATKGYVDAAIAAIPVIPTNVISGWVIQDLATNLQYFVTSSNLSFKVWEVK